MRSDLAEAARRGAHTMVHSLGATAVVLMIPAPPVAGDTGEELGLRTPEFQRMTLAPVAVRLKVRSAEVVAPADALEALLGLTGSGAVETAMSSVSTVQVGDEAFVLTATETVASMGSACLYRLLLQLPPTEVV